jgi:hypothetical protein
MSFLLTDRYGMKKARSVRQQNEVLPRSRNPEYSLLHASLSHNRIIGRLKSHSKAGGLVRRHSLLVGKPAKEVRQCQSMANWVKEMV